MSRRKVTLFLVVAAASAFCVVLAGSLEPSGPPAPTMKDLDTVEPRVPIRNDFIGLTPIVIDSPGSYYLAEDIFAFFNNHGIEINADNVTLDMRGFTLYGNTEVGSFDGIHVELGRENVRIQNGTVRDFFQDGIDIQADNARVIDVLAVNNFQTGIRTGSGALIRNCVASDNGGDGIFSSSGSTVIDSEARDNGGVGIRSASAVIANSNAYSNGGDGIFTNNGSVVRGCSAVFNTQDGIDAQQSLIQGNSVSGNGGAGIVNHPSSVLVDNNT